MRLRLILDLVQQKSSMPACSVYFLRISFDGSSANIKAIDAKNSPMSRKTMSIEFGSMIKLETVMPISVAADAVAA